MMPADPELAAALATINTHMEHTQSALVGLDVEMKDARRENSERTAAIHGRLNEVNTTLAGFSERQEGIKEDLAQHADADEKRFGLLWKIILGGGAVAGGGTGIFQVIGGG